MKDILSNLKKVIISTVRDNFPQSTVEKELFLDFEESSCASYVRMSLQTNIEKRRLSLPKKGAVAQRLERQTIRKIEIDIKNIRQKVEAAASEYLLVVGFTVTPCPGEEERTFVNDNNIIKMFIEHKIATFPDWFSVNFTPAHSKD